jgi:hypothetical protein
MKKKFSCLPGNFQKFGSRKFLQGGSGLSDVFKISADHSWVYLA